MKNKTSKTLSYKLLVCLHFIFITVFLNSCRASNNEPEVRNIILMIGDGMGLNQVYGAYTASKGELNIFQFPVTGILLTYSEDNYITDSAAGATAFACGEKTNNGSVGVDKNGVPLKNIFEYAAEKNVATGIVVTCEYTHATPAAFFAHVKSRKSEKEIAYALSKTETNLVIAGGRKYLSDTLNGEIIENTLKKRGFQIKKQLNELNDQVKKQICLISESHLPPYALGRGNFLPDATEKAINILSQNSHGFILMVEGSQIDWGGHDNSINYVISETLDFDRAVGKALEFAKKDGHTLVIVIADHETGGLTLTGGDINSGKIISHFSTTDHTASPIVMFAFGPKSELFTGIHQNTQIFHLIKKILKF